MLRGPAYWELLKKMFSCFEKSIPKVHALSWEFPLLWDFVFQKKINFVCSCVMKEMRVSNIWVYQPPILCREGIFTLISIRIDFSMSRNVIHISHCKVRIISQRVSTRLWNFFHFLVVLSLVAIILFHYWEPLLHEFSIFVSECHKDCGARQNYSTINSHKVSWKEEEFRGVNIEICFNSFSIGSIILSDFLGG